MSLDLLFLGTGDAFGSGGRLQTASLLTAPDVRVLVDCGSSTLPALRRAGVDPESIDILLLTHLHGDHFGGVPFFLMDAHYASRRTRPLVIAGPGGAEARVALAQEAFFPGHGTLPVAFPLAWAEWTDRRRVTWPGVSVTPVAVSHSESIPCYGLRVDCGGRTVAFSGDTGWTPRLPELAHGADLFVCECFGFESAPPGHLDYRTLREAREELACRRLILTHMSDSMLSRLDDLDVETATDGGRTSV